MKKLISFLLCVILCISMVPSALAANLSDVENNDVVSTITVQDENGNSVQYDIKNNTHTQIPLYTTKESTGEFTTAGVEEVATLDIWVQAGLLQFRFTPVNVVVFLITLGFVGSLTSYQGGNLYGLNPFATPTLSGWCGAPPHGTGNISGTYLVAGYAAIPIFYSLVW